MPRPDKVTDVAELTEHFRSSNAAVLTEYRGLTVAQLTELRSNLGTTAHYAVVKNTLTKIAVRDAGLQELESLLQGPSAIAFIKGDTVEAAKSLRDFAKANPLLVIKGGVLDGKLVTAAELAKIADLESREVLLAKVAGAANAALAKAAALFQAPLAQAARLVEALRAQVAENQLRRQRHRPRLRKRRRRRSPADAAEAAGRRGCRRSSGRRLPRQPSRSPKPPSRSPKPAATAEAPRRTQHGRTLNRRRPTPSSSRSSHRRPQSRTYLRKDPPPWRSSAPTT